MHTPLNRTWMEVNWTVQRSKSSCPTCPFEPVRVLVRVPRLLAMDDTTGARTTITEEQEEGGITEDAATPVPCLVPGAVRLTVDLSVARGAGHVRGLLTPIPHTAVDLLQVPVAEVVEGTEDEVVEAQETSTIIDPTLTARDHVLLDDLEEQGVEVDLEAVLRLYAVVRPVTLEVGTPVVAVVPLEEEGGTPQEADATRVRIRAPGQGRTLSVRVDPGRVRVRTHRGRGLVHIPGIRGVGAGRGVSVGEGGLTGAPVGMILGIAGRGAHPLLPLRPFYHSSSQSTDRKSVV